MTRPPDVGPTADLDDEVAAASELGLGPPSALSRFACIVSAGPVAALEIVPVDDHEADEEADALGLSVGVPRRALRSDRIRLWHSSAST